MFILSRIFLNWKNFSYIFDIFGIIFLTRKEYFDKPTNLKANAHWYDATWRCRAGQTSALRFISGRLSGQRLYKVKQTTLPLSCEAEPWKWWTYRGRVWWPHRSLARTRSTEDVASLTSCIRGRPWWRWNNTTSRGRTTTLCDSSPHTLQYTNKGENLV